MTAATTSVRSAQVSPSRRLDLLMSAQFGSNKLAEAEEPGWQAFLRQYRDLMQLSSSAPQSSAAAPAVIRRCSVVTR